MSTSLSNGDGHQVVASNLIDVDNFVVDWIHNNIYWTDAHRMTISASNLGKILFPLELYPNISF